MKCMTLNVTPATYGKAMNKLRALLTKKGDAEITLSFAGGSYRVGEAMCFDASTSTGEKRPLPS